MRAEDSWIAFDPEQAKSATGNIGEFSPTNQDIRYNVATDWYDNNAPASVKSIVTNAMHSDKATSLLTPFNTQYHKAQAWAAEGKTGFKRLFDLTQRFISDVSRFAIMAQSKAPTLFHEMRSAGDVGRYLKGIRSFGDLTGATHTADLNAIAAPLYEGTLYGGGSPMSGVIFSDDRLRSEYNLTDRQIRLYREALASAGVSMDELVKSVIAGHAKTNKVAFDREMTVGDMADDVARRLEELKAEKEEMIGPEAQERANAEAADLREQDMDDEADALLKSAKKDRADAIKGIARIDKTITDIRAAVAKNTKLQEHGYFPLMRFGKHVVKATSNGGKVTEFRGHYEGIPLVPRSGQYEANKVAAAIRAEHPDWTVTTEIDNDEKHKLYAGLNMEALRLFAEHMDADMREPLQEYFREAVGDRSVLKRLIHRKGTPGFDNDVRRTLAQFITSNARHTSSSYHIGDMTKAAEAANEDGGDIGKEAVKLLKYVQDPQDEAANLRGFLFFHFLGGSIAAAIVNATQVPMMTFPYLTRYESAGALGKRLALAAKMAVKNPASIGGELGAALQQAELDGVTAPQEIHQLISTAANNIFAGNRLANGFLRAWGAPFAMAESFNRRTTFIAAYQIAEGMTPAELAATKAATPFEFAERAVTDTQGIYNKGNRMNVGRGAIGSTLMTFKQYNIMYLELLKRMPPKQRAIMLGVLFMAAGGSGWPFVEDIEDIIDTIGQWLGYGTNSKKALRNAAESALGLTGADIALNGALNQMGISLHSRFGMGNLIPGSAILKESSIDRTRDIAEFFGPAASVLQNASKALKAMATGQPGRAAMAVAPNAIANAIKGEEMARTGYAEDSQGRRTVPVNGGEAFAKGVGFNPKSVADFGDVKGDVLQDVHMVSVKREEFTSAIADAILSGDVEARQQALADMRQWNEDNPKLRVVLTPGAVLKRVRDAKLEGVQRFLKTVPKTMRSDARADLVQ
ncbi:MAG: PLxRFG domain-containing protein [Candidatus Accumulibacter sp.]|nr:PLxRFG domain-containing protein [Accumulibacter sp.]